jgi:hypothetical protein
VSWRALARKMAYCGPERQPRLPVSEPEPAHAWRGDEDKGPRDSRAICLFLVRMSSRQGRGEPARSDVP